MRKLVCARQEARLLADRWKVLGFAVLLLFAACGDGDATRPLDLSGGHNPVISTEGLADPAVIRHEGRYYLYPTDDGLGYDVYVSDDLLNWTKAARAFDHDGPNLWAPDVYYDPSEGQFYLYYSANLRIGVAVANSPLGPFEDRGILIEAAIDAHLFRDDDGHLYLYYEGFDAGSRILAQRMRTPLEPEGEPIALLEPEGWERDFDHPIVEGPWVLKRDGIYYLMYSGNAANTADYAIGYATSSTPTGPFVRFPGNPIISKRDGLFGPGHHSVVEAPDGQMVIVYHQKATAEIRWDRFVSIDRMGFDDEGQIWVTPTPLNPSRMVEVGDSWIRF